MSVGRIKRKKNGLKKPAWAIELDMFKLSVGVFLSRDDLIKYVKKSFGIKLSKNEFSRTARAEAGYVMDKDGLKYFYMLFNEENPNIGIIAHESVHVAGAICHEVGVPVSRDCDETLAYMVDYLVQCTVDEFRALQREGKV